MDHEYFYIYCCPAYGNKAGRGFCCIYSQSDSPVFSMSALAVLLVSILVKGYMFCYNKRFSKITGSETLKATAADCMSDSLATAAVLISTTVSYITHLEIDGYCGVLVSAFIIFAGIKAYGKC